MRRLLVLLLVGGGFAPPASGETAVVEDDRVWIVVRASSREERTLVADCGIPLEHLGPGRAGGIARPAAAGCVKAAGFKILELRPLVEMWPEGFPEADSVYHDFAEMKSVMADLAAAAPDAISLSVVGTTHQGRDISVLRINTSPESSAKPGLLFIGNHHAREHLSTEVPLLMARWMAEHKDDPGFAPLLASRDVYFMPMLNGDGSEYDIDSGRYRWQRKNMRRNGNGTTGVDLNRNYGHGWGGSGASANPGSDTYRGPTAFSEPESRAVRDFLRAHKNIRIVVAYHSYGGEVLYPWSDVYAPIPDARARKAFKTMSDTMGKMMDYESKQSSDLYASSGDTCDWAWAELKIFCFTIELPPRSYGGGFYPGPEAIAPAVAENLKSALYLMEMAEDPYSAPAGGRSSAGAPLPGEAASRRIERNLSNIEESGSSQSRLFD